MNFALLLLLCLAQGDGDDTDGAAIDSDTAKRHKRDEFVRVEVTCTTLAGDSVYLDRGRESGIEPGDKLRLFPPEGASRFGKIVSISRTSSRARIANGLDGLDIGVRGIVFVPRARHEKPAPAAEPAPAPSAAPAPAPPAPPGPRVPEHPPWTSPPETWNQDSPLLAPAHGVAPEDRPRRFEGLITSSVDWTDDSAGTDVRKFLAVTLGAEGRMENPFGHGGELGFDVEEFARSSDTNGETERESRLRVDRLSYAWGGVRGERERGEVGRFLQHEFPEFGFLDGVEYARRLRGASLFGASVGFQPEPDDLFHTGNDVQAAVFGRYVSDEERRFTLGAGYQKTWHEGAADRDLLASQLEFHPSTATALFASALIDLYTSGDDLKSPGPELTQLFLNASLRSPGGNGLGLFASRFRFPDLLRNEFDAVTAQEIMDSRNDRLGVDGWLDLGSPLLLYGRVERWADQDDSGGGGRARATWRDALGPGGPVLCELYVNSGKFSQSTGLRASARKRTSTGSLGLSWDATEYDQDGVDETLLQHTVRADLEFGFGRGWFLALYAESRFGDEQDALALGFTLQRSFD